MGLSLICTAKIVEMTLAELVDIDVQVHHQTDRAILVSEEGEEKIWLPLSQIEVVISVDGFTATVTMPEWLALEKELI